MFDDFPALRPQLGLRSGAVPGLAGFAWESVDWELGSKVLVYPPHVPMSQSATRPLGRQLAYQIEFQTLAGSHHIACKLHATTEDYHPPGRPPDRISRLLQPSI